MRQTKSFILNGLVICFLLLLTGFLIYQNVTQPSIIKKDNLTLFLATDGSVLHSEEVEEDKIKKIAIYFPETKQTNYLHHERYQIFFDDHDFMQTMYERTAKTGDIFAAYVFYPEKKYSSNFMYGVKQEYILNPGQDNAIKYAIEYRNNSRQKEVLHYYEYYPNTKFNENPKQHIKQVYYLDNYGYVDYSIELERGTGRKLVKHHYADKTRYDQKDFVHQRQIIASERID